MSWRSNAVRAFLAIVLVVIVGAGTFQWILHSSDFPELSASSMDQWHSYGGDWHVADGVITDRIDGRGDKIIAGPKNYGNYTVTAELRFDSTSGDPQFGDAGLLVRVQDPAIGVDAHRGFYAGLRLDDHTLLIGSQSFTFREMATAQFPHEIRTGRWYRLTFASTGCTFHASVEDTETSDRTEVSYVERSCSPLQGQIGLRSYYAKASWRRLKVKLIR
ncbi:MAG TPA: family 16 glycoside hydrolase [Edaphobacter sp.]|nr:family 16 glycoside hydrolase [Edaphobacter sp.]